VYALDAGTGEQIWQFETGNDVRSSPTVVNGTIYVGSADDSVYALDASTGEEVWSFDTSGAVESSPTVVDGIVYVGSADNSVYALDAGTGEEVWSFDTGGAVESSPTVVDGIVYVGSADDSVYALDADMGAKDWLFNTGGVLRSSPTVMDGTVYVGSDNNRVYALDADTGTEDWSFNTGGDIGSPTVVADPQSGDSIGSRARLGTLGHHSNWRYAEQSIDIKRWGIQAGELPTLGGTGLVALFGVYGLLRPHHLDGQSDRSLSTKEKLRQHPGIVLAVTGLVLSIVTMTLLTPVGRYTPWLLNTHQLIFTALFSGLSLRSVLAATTIIGWTLIPLGLCVESRHGESILRAVPGIDQTTVSGSLPIWYSIVGVLSLVGLVYNQWWTYELTVSLPALLVLAAVSHHSVVSKLPPIASYVPLPSRDALTGLMPRRDTSGAEKRPSSQQPDDSPAGNESRALRRESNGGQASEMSEPDGETATPETRIDDHLDTSRQYLSSARDAHDAGEYERALARCERAIGAAKEARATAREGAPDRVPDAEAALDDATALREAIQAERDARQQATDALDTAEGALDDAAAALDGGSPEAALETLAGVAESLDTARMSVEDHGFPALAEHVATLEQRHERLRQTAREARTRVPAEIPGVTRHSLSYADIEKRGELGRGGNADVFRATARTDGGDIDIALKEPRMSGDGTLHTEVVERMMDEAETWQRLDDHDHIVGVVDYGSEPLPWIAMEHMDAGHLGERAGDLPVDQALWTAIATAEGVRHAHRRGVAHLDLKPENVLFRAVADTWDAPKVADWGLSKHLLEHSKSVEGVTPYYAAPEQFADGYGTPDDITDVYQLGAVFYELFTGRPPFEGRPMRVMRQVETEQPTPPSELADVPEGLDDVLLTALATERDERYDAVVLLRNDLQELFESV
jgi:hypothetical protein